MSSSPNYVNIIIIWSKGRCLSIEPFTHPKVSLPIRNDSNQLPHPKVSVTQQYWYTPNKGYVAPAPIRPPYTGPLKHKWVFIILIVYAAVSLFFCLPLSICSILVAKRAYTDYKAGVFKQAIGLGITTGVMSTLSIFISLALCAVMVYLRVVLLQEQNE